MPKPIPLLEGWKYNRFPDVPFTVNWNSPQSEALSFWMPFHNDAGADKHIDLVGGLSLTQFVTPTWENTIRGWALDFTRGDQEYLEIDTAAATEAPLTLSCWINTDSITVVEWAVTLHDLSATNQGFRLGIDGTDPSDSVMAFTYAGGFSIANSTAGVSLDTWHHICGVFESPTSRAAFLDGGNKGTNGNNRAPTGIDRTSIGRAGDATPGAYWAGLISDVRVYKRALSDSEVFELYSNPYDLYLPLAPSPYWMIPFEEVPVSVRVPKPPAAYNTLAIY